LDQKNRDCTFAAAPGQGAAVVICTHGRAVARGGKDGIPYPVDRPTYDKPIDVLKNAVRKAKLWIRDEMETLRRLHKMFD